MANTLDKLHPYKSFVLARIKDEFEPSGLVDYSLQDLRGMLNLGDGTRRQLVNLVVARQDEELEVGYIHFTEHRLVSWIDDPSLVDVINHLALICRRNRHIGICITDSSFRSSVVRRFDRGETAGLGALQTISAGLINAAFVRGDARTLWLSAAHRRTTVKADSKILSGIDLRDALDPIDDQSYYFTAARCRTDMEGVEGSIGSAPRSSKVWLGVTDEWKEFRSTVTALLTRLEETRRPESSPLPVIAVTSIDVEKVKGAFDVALVSPELAGDDPSTDDDSREILERWSYGGNFEILETDGPSFLAKLSLKGASIGTAKFDIQITNPEKVTWHVSGEPTEEDVRELHEEALKACRNLNWLKVWYGSGHALTNGALFEMRYRDMPFRGYSWGGFRNFDITREKPDPLTEVGRQDSLFCWIKQRWNRGWLACDDGSMEIADFIHLDDQSTPPVLSLIHAKGAGSKESSRGISVSKYEVVTGQAVKNLRSLDRQLLDEGLSQGIARKIGALVWHNDRSSDRHRMLAALGQIGADYERRVVIVQPHLSRTAYEHARQHRRSRDSARLRQLDALLLGAEAAVHGTGSTLIVFGER